ncbi:V-type ATPase subunit [Candidatus Margulisiibacteriota bacterium]
MEEHHYGVGRIRSLEARLISPAQVARMSAAADFSEAFGVLSETPYSDNLPRLKSPFDFEELCELEQLSLKGLLDRLAPDNEIIAALFKEHDYLNLKILLRSYFSRTKEIKLFAKAGTIAFDKLRLYVFEGVKGIDDKEIVEAVDAARKAHEKDKDPQTIDLVLDKHYYAGLKRLLSASPSPLIRELADHKLDLNNLKTVLRAQALKKNKKSLKAALLDTGAIDPDILLDLLDKTPQDIISRLSFTQYFPALAAGIEHYDKDRSFCLLEKLMDNYIIEQFKMAKYLSSGLEPLVGFYLAKENEIKTLRFILVSKRNYLSTEQIKARIRASYV